MILVHDPGGDDCILGGGLGPNDVVERCQHKFSASVDEGVYYPPRELQ